MAQNIEIVFAPALYQYHSKGGNVVLIDVVRFTTTLITALANGAISAEAYPDPDSPLRLKNQCGYLTAGEIGSEDIPGFDFNNSPVSMTRENVEGKRLAFCTTNGTYTRSVINDYEALYAGAFVNGKALVNRLENDKRNVKLVCSGKNRLPAIEDTIFAGYVAKSLIETGNFSYNDDCVPMAITLYDLAKNNLKQFILDHSPLISTIRNRNPKYRDDFDMVVARDIYDIVPEEISPLKFIVKR